MAITNWLSSVATSQFDNNTRSYYLFSFVYFNLFWLWRKKGCHTGQTRIFDFDIGFYMVICVWTNTIHYLFIRVTPIWSLWYQKPITHPYVSLFSTSMSTFSRFLFSLSLSTSSSSPFFHLHPPALHIPILKVLNVLVLYVLLPSQKYMFINALSWSISYFKRIEYMNCNTGVAFLGV